MASLSVSSSVICVMSVQKNFRFWRFSDFGILDKGYSVCTVCFLGLVLSVHFSLSVQGNPEIRWRGLSILQTKSWTHKLPWVFARTTSS
jgi:hypothetical protein